MPQAVDVSQVALAREDLLRPLARKAQRLGEGSQQLDDLRDVVVVLTILGARLRIEEVVSGDELENLAGMPSACACPWGGGKLGKN